MKHVLLYLTVSLLGAALVAAHDPGLSSAEVTVGSRQVFAHLVFSGLEIEALGGGTEIGESALEIVLDGRAVAGRVRSIELDASDALHLELVFAAEPASRLLVRSPILAKLARGHRQHVKVLDQSGARIAERVVDARDPTLATSVHSGAQAAVSPSSFGAFLLLGLEHILTGYDHLLFLLGVLVAGGGFWGVVRIITSFTLAHSITLALATFDWVRVPPELVEPVIAASILYIGLENLLRREPRHRALLTFLFGLVHGLGFASVLRHLGIGAMGGSAVTPLLAFNLGVEIGQVAVAALVLPLIWKGASRRELGPRLSTVCSIFVAIAGAVWLWERTLGWTGFSPP